MASLQFPSTPSTMTTQLSLCSISHPIHKPSSSLQLNDICSQYHSPPIKTMIALPLLSTQTTTAVSSLAPALTVEASPSIYYGHPYHRTILTNTSTTTNHQASSSDPRQSPSTSPMNYLDHRINPPMRAQLENCRHRKIAPRHLLASRIPTARSL
ncbi:hypothetical protein M0R45_007971 [Rubus argutus]|uniref:Uncharacterized protein n=1 Tax=Rubus argutus TaxID=59490 RepID=A0AAW1Y356_RUBAR